MGSPGHFESVADTYASARPPYPQELYDVLEQAGVIGVGHRILEIGAGTGQATAELLARGCDVTAVEPGEKLARRLAVSAPAAIVLRGRVETLDLSEGAYDSAVAATSMHWVNLPLALPRLARALVPGGCLAVWRTIFGDPRVSTPFRAAVAQIKGAGSRTPGQVLDPRPTVDELGQGGWFQHELTWTHRWHADLDAEAICRLFGTFSDWSVAELSTLEAAARAHGPMIREHYVTHLHVLRRT